MIIGVDEAGKGPVLGPMFVVGVRSSEFSDNIPDSKKVSDSKREILCDFLLSECEFSVVEVSPNEIDNSNINDLVIESHSEVISDLFEDSDSVFCDACLNDVSSYKKRLSNYLNFNCNMSNFTCENSADDSYDIVGAASIIAKQKRENYMKSLNDKFDENIGSGYPSDSKTFDFLESFYKREGRLPDSARKSWSTCDDILQSSFESF